MGTIKDRNDMDITEAKMLRRGGKNTQKNYTKKDFQDPNKHSGVLTQSQTSWSAKSGWP